MAENSCYVINFEFYFIYDDSYSFIGRIGIK